MKLKDYLRRNKIHAVEFALSCGISISSLYSYLRGETTPRIEAAMKISRETKGKVSIEDMMCSVVDKRVK